MALPDQENPRQHPLEKSYGVNLSIAIFALVPFIVVTTAYDLFEKRVGSELGITRNALAIISALSTAGYAFGALLGGDVIQRFPQRRLFLACESLFAAGCALAASALGLCSLGRVMF